MDEAMMKEITGSLAAAGRILVTAHDRPDGDALGAVLGMARILCNFRDNVFMVGCQPVTERYRLLMQKGEEFVEISEAAPDREDTVLVVLDCGAASRGAEVEPWLGEGGEVVNIDHHASNSMFGALNWVESHASSTSEMIVRLCQVAGWQIPRPAAEALWAGIITDTGRFCYENTSEDTLRTAADLVALGVSPGHMGELLYQSVPIVEARLSSRALQSLETSYGGQVAWVVLRRQDFEELGCGPEDSGEVINLPRNLAGVRIAFYFYEVPQAEISKVSIRTSAPFDATELAGRFDGGGHQRAAGGHSEVAVEELRDRVLEAVAELWDTELSTTPS